MEPRSPALQADSLPAEPQRKPKNTGVGRLSLLQGIFPTQGWNPGLLHCWWILYQLSHKRSPGDMQVVDLIPVLEDPLEEGMAIHSSILAWRIPQTEIWQPTVHRVTKSQR